jgi:hypothetical protein
MQPTAAALCAACLAVPAALPSGSVLADAPGRDLAVSASAVKLVAATVAALPANPTLLEVLGLPIQTANNIFAEGTTGALALPAGFPLTSAQYVSVFEALNAYIKVGSTVASQLVNGQFEQIAGSFQTNLAAANTALAGLPSSIAASLQYNLDVIAAFIATLGAGTPTTPADAATTEATTLAAADVTTDALPANPTLLEVLGLPIQTVNNIIEEGTTGALALPAGFPLTSAQYVSAFEVLNAYIKVGSTVASQLVNGQFEQIPASFQTNLDAANTALAGFVPSVAASTQYLFGVISNFLAAPNATTTTMADTAATTVKAAAVSDASPSALPDSPTALEVLGLQIQTLNNIFEEGTTGALALPAGFSLSSADYVSVFEALNAYIKVGSTLASQLVNGQFEQISSSFQTNLAAANAALAGLPSSIAASVQYDTQVIGNFLSPSSASKSAATTTADTATVTPKALVAAAPKASDSTDTTDATDTADAATTKAAASTDTTSTAKPKAGGFLKQLQAAVDKEVGGGAVKVAAPDKASDSDSTSSTKSDAPKSTKSHTDKKSGSAKSAGSAK